MLGREVISSHIMEIVFLEAQGWGVVGPVDFEDAPERGQQCWRCFCFLQKSALLNVQRADLLKVHPVVCCSSPCPEYLIKPYNAIFLKSPGFKDIKTDIPNP